MIVPGTRFTLAEVPLSRIILTETQPRYPDRLLHYFELLTDPRHVNAFAGIVHLAPYGTNTHTGERQYTLLDGHHRFCAAVLAGRATLLALIHIEPGMPEYDEATDASLEALCTGSSAHCSVPSQQKM